MAKHLLLNLMKWNIKYYIWQLTICFLHFFFSSQDKTGKNYGLICMFFTLFVVKLQIEQIARIVLFKILYFVFL